MQLLGIDIQYYILTAGAAYLILGALLWRRLYSLFDPLHVNIVFTSMPMAIGALLLQYKGAGGFILFGALCAGLLAFALTIRKEKVPVSPAYGRQRDILRNNMLAQLAAIVICVLIIANFGINILASNYRVGVDADAAKFLVSQNSRLLFLFALNFSPIVFGLVYLFWGTAAGYLALLTFIIQPISDTFAGQKGGIPAALISLFFIRYLRRIDSKTENRGMDWIEVPAAIAVVFLVIIATALIRGEAGTAGLTVLHRLLIGFDQIATVIITNFPVHAYKELDLFQLDFSSLLKVLHLYTLKYNSIGHFIAVEAAGFPIDYDGSLPNSNAAAEFVFSLGPWIGIPALTVWAWINGKLYLYFFRRRYESISKALFFLTMLAGPYNFLINGSGYTTRLYLVLFFVAPIALLEAYLRDPRHVPLALSKAAA